MPRRGRNWETGAAMLLLIWKRKTSSLILIWNGLCWGRGDPRAGGTLPASHISSFFRFLLILGNKLKIPTDFFQVFQKAARLDFRWACLCRDQECVAGPGRGVLPVVCRSPLLPPFWQGPRQSPLPSPTALCLTSSILTPIPGSTQLPQGHTLEVVRACSGRAQSRQGSSHPLATGGLGRGLGEWRTLSNQLPEKNPKEESQLC